MVSKQDLSANMVRKVDAIDTPKNVTSRLKTERQVVIFEKLRQEQKQRTGNTSDQKTFEFILRLAEKKIDEFDNIDSEIEDCLS
ncbi:hypothetical protein [Candidatus Nanohalococcus occultus]|uniref:hypothetical protein n=1 Tax=Candidatus Nanohalococcus occultus TaxID=2978047 RepID=UPI0039DF5856